MQCKSLKRLSRKGIFNSEIYEIDEDELEYPFLLSQIYNKPKKLYVIGNKELLREECTAIVGCRKCSQYGAICAEKISYGLAKKNIVIVSGLAIGIDSNAHKGAINAKGKTIAVVAHGLDSIYPKENTKLAFEIIKSGGAIVSEYELGVKAEKNNFSQRNRIISGLSKNTIVVEARKRSGSLITANLALEQGRNVYAVPGNILSMNSEGANNLIKSGAEILTKLDDIIL